MFLLVSLFNVISISVVIKVLLDLKRNGTMINRENITAMLDQLNSAGMEGLVMDEEKYKPNIARKTTIIQWPSKSYRCLAVF